MPFCTSQDLEALHEELTRPLAMTAINCPFFSGMQKSNDNCVIDVCCCAKLDVAFSRHAVFTSPGCPACPRQHIAEAAESLYQRQYCIASCLYMLNIKAFSVLMLLFGLPKQLAVIRIFLSVRTTNR